MSTEYSHFQEYCLFRQGISPRLADKAIEGPVNIHCGDELDRMCGLRATIEGSPSEKEFPDASLIGECAFKLANGYAAENLQIWPGNGIVASADF